MNRRQSKKIPVSFDIVIENHNTGEDISRYQYTTVAPEGDEDYITRVAQAVEGTLFVRAENLIYEQQ